VSRWVKVALQVAVSGGVIAYLLWQIDISRTADLIVESNPGYLAAALAIFLATTLGMAWRWQILLASKGIQEPLAWLARLYFVSYAAGQILPTTIGGDAVRIIEHSRRRPTSRGEAAGAVLMERVVGAAGTLLLVAVGLAVAAGRYEDIAVLVWLEVAFVAGTIVLGALLFSRRAHRLLQERVFPRTRRLRIDRALASVWAALHGYRDQPVALVVVVAVTVSMQAARIMAIWLCGEAVGLDLSPLVYVILGPLLFLVMLVPFTINGLGVREAFFVAFLSRFDVTADPAFATGFLFYAVTIAASLPGGFILLWRSLRQAFAHSAERAREDAP
jgi:glycosyltransferase 2 family protein